MPSSRSHAERPTCEKYGWVGDSIPSLSTHRPTPTTRLNGATGQTRASGRALHLAESEACQSSCLVAGEEEKPECLCRGFESLHRYQAPRFPSPNYDFLRLR